MTLERGSLLNNRYRVVEILGRGGMGSVYRAVDENLGVEVALKENLFTTTEYERQFRTEAVILATLRHPHLTRVTDHFVIDGQGQYLVMDYIEGEDLRQRMDRLGIISEEEAVLIGAAICDALSYLHSRTPPVIHRDIKPGNVKITPQGQIFLVDFGLAKIIQSGQATTTGARAMTPGYSPPEQYGTARTDNRSDIFSLGATLYAALTGTIPEDALARAMDQANLSKIGDYNPKVSRHLVSVIEKSLAVRPDDRYQTADEFKKALLSIRGVTRPRKTGDYTVEPPPVSSGDLGYYPSTSIAKSSSIEYVPGTKNGTPYKLLGGSPPGEPQPSKRSGLQRRTGCMFIVLVGLIVIAAGIVAYTLYPSWPVQAQQALAVLIPISSNPISIVPDNSSPTPTSSSSTVTILVETATPSPTLTVTPTRTPTAPPAPTSTATSVPPTPTQTSTPVPIGGGSGEIAFASDRSGTTQIWILDVEGISEPRQLTDILEGACQPTWSPDGKRLVFTSPCSGNQELYPGSGLFLMNADGTGLSPMPNVPGGDFDPAWSPDGKQIAFTSMRNGGRARIYLLDLDDNSVQRLSERYFYDRQPDWSSDGRKIAFVSTQKGPVQIWTMDPDGSNQEMYTRSGEKINSLPQWSLDGELILFTQNESPGRIPGIVVASYIEGEYNEFRYDGLGSIPALEARYSPDGLWLAFESWPQGQNHDIYIMTASGANRTQLTDWERFDFDPAWRPPVRN